MKFYFTFYLGVGVEEGVRGGVGEGVEGKGIGEEK